MGKECPREFELIWGALWGREKRPGEDPRCPSCGLWCQTLYAREGKILGCESCIRVLDAWDVEV